MAELAVCDLGHAGFARRDLIHPLLSGGVLAPNPGSASCQGGQTDGAA